MLNKKKKSDMDNWEVKKKQSRAASMFYLSLYSKGTGVAWSGLSPPPPQQATNASNKINPRPNVLLSTELPPIRAEESLTAKTAKKHERLGSR